MPSQAAQQTDTAALRQLKETIAEIQDLNSIQALLGWDLETKMPKLGAGIRANQMGTLTRISHQKMTAPELKPLLETLQNESSQGKLDTTGQAIVREFSRDYEKSTKLPGDMLERLVQLTAEAHYIWIEAREKKQFSIFQPILQQLVDLNRQMADIVGYSDSPYDALMDDYEPGLTVKQLDPLFASLRESLVGLLKKIEASGKKPNQDFLFNQIYATDKQLSFSSYILEEMGFDFAAGRLDLSAHPFSSGTGYADIRLTTRVQENDLFSALSSSMHEGGHGMYEQNVNPGLYRTNLGDGTSLGIHESQSRMWENVIGRGKPMWQHYFAKLQSHFAPQLDSISLEQFYPAINVVKPSFIRVEADEVTYNLHILVRYEIEKALIEGSLSVNDIPDTWNAKYQEYLGVTPPDDAVGCLQDVHWSHGSFGYFPTYTLGNLYSAQFYNQAKKDIAGLEEKLAKGDLKVLAKWLKEQIHWVGKSERPETIVKRVCNEPLNSQYFIDYLNAKYTALYSL